jgi:hypothetical protein
MKRLVNGGWQMLTKFTLDPRQDFDLLALIYFIEMLLLNLYLFHGQEVRKLRIMIIEVQIESNDLTQPKGLNYSPLQVIRVSEGRGKVENRKGRCR